MGNGMAAPGSVDGRNIRRAFLMAVVVPAGLGIPLMMVIGLFGAGMSPGIALLLCVVNLIVSAAHLVLAVPAYLLARHRQAIRRSVCIGSGLAIGALPTLCLMSALRIVAHPVSPADWFYIAGLYSPLAFVIAVGTMGVLGAVGGRAFWMIYQDGLMAPESEKPAG